MKNGKYPDPNMIHPIAGYDNEIYVKPTITNPNIIVGDFTYIADSEFENICMPVKCCKEKGIDFCAFCNNFPCDDMADFYEESKSHKEAYHRMVSMNADR